MFMGYCLWCHLRQLAMSSAFPWSSFTRCPRKVCFNLYLNITASLPATHKWHVFVKKRAKNFSKSTSNVRHLVKSSCLEVIGSCIFTNWSLSICLTQVSHSGVVVMASINAVQAPFLFWSPMLKIFRTAWMTWTSARNRTQHLEISHAVPGTREQNVSSEIWCACFCISVWIKRSWEGHIARATQVNRRVSFPRPYFFKNSHTPDCRRKQYHSIAKGKNPQRTIISHWDVDLLLSVLHRPFSIWPIFFVFGPDANKNY